MSRRAPVTSASSTGSSSGGTPVYDGGMFRGPQFLPRRAGLTILPGQEKQKMLLSADTGHFSMIRFASAVVSLYAEVGR